MSAFQNYGRVRNNASAAGVSALAIKLFPAGAPNRAFWVRVTFMIQNLASGATMIQTREATVLGGTAPVVTDAGLQPDPGLGGPVGAFVIAANGTDIEAQWSTLAGAINAKLLVDAKIMYFGDAYAPDGVLSVALAAWYRADDPTITKALGKVSVWPDKGPSGDANRNCVQATGARQPSFVEHDPDFAGQPSVDATAGGNIQLRSPGDWTIPINQPYTVFLVGKIDPGGTILFDGKNTDNNLIYDNANGKWDVFNGATLNTGISRVPPAVCVFIVNGVTSRAYISRSAPVVGDAGALNVSNRITLFGDNSGAFSGGKLAELAIWPGAITEAEAQALLVYGSGRYGIELV
jgi:hypothetical protein